MYDTSTRVMNIPQKGKIKIFGVICVLAGLVLNKWFLGNLFAEDGHIDQSSIIVAIHVFDMFCVVAGGMLIWRADVVAGYVPNAIVVPLRWDVLISLISGFVLVLLGVFFYGFAVGTLDIYPANGLRKLKKAITAIEARASFAVADSADKKGATGWHTQYVSVPEEGRSGVVLNKGEDVADGYTFFSGWGCAARLISPNGTVVHVWQKSARKVLPAIGKSAERAVLWRKARPLPNGELLAIYDNVRGRLYRNGPLVKLDASSRVKWIADIHAHHDFDVGLKGRVFVLTCKKQNGKRHDQLTILTSGGEVLKNISLVDAVKASSYAHFLPFELKGDILHANTVDILSASQKAEGFSRFEKGDILLAFRDINTIAVMDGSRYEIKWAAKGLGQAPHDPDFLAKGRIMLFDNRYQRDPRVPTSRIVIYSLDRLTPVWSYANRKFYTKICGSQQKLPNGNVLVTETEGGTIFEVTPDKRVVWKYRSVHRAPKLFRSGEFIGRVHWAQRYKQDYFADGFHEKLRRRD